jgi:hypothetical protein
MTHFLNVVPTTENRWRALILLGRNTASYKFALGRALLELKSSPGDLLTLEELALPFALRLCDHLKLAPKQGITNINRALREGCNSFNRGELDQEALRGLAFRHGFGDVIDAFHVLSGRPLDERFFIDERETCKGIRLTDAFRRLAERPATADLTAEIEARWRVVETGWQLGLHPGVVEFERDTGALIMRSADRRLALSSCRSTLNGYQKGRCFYCFGPISIDGGDTPADVDHFFPWGSRRDLPNVDGIWNLVLACTHCNRGVEGKFALIPALHLLDRLYRRNEFYIDSRHSLAATLKAQTGPTEHQRRSFLQKAYDDAIQARIHRWKPEIRGEEAF